MNTRIPSISSGQIVIVDDDEVILQVCQQALSRRKHQTYPFSDPLQVIAHLEQHPADVVLTDYMMPQMNGLDLLAFIKQRWPHTEVIMMTGYASIETALTAMKSGAYDYLQKPFEQIEVAVFVVEKALEHKRLLERNLELEQRLDTFESFEGIVGSSPSMQQVFRLVDQVARFDASVLITGETGTGKERIARVIHQKSPRKNRPFTPVVCSAIPENLLESTLFGHRKGSFTGASQDHTGLIEATHQGTLFLDEIGDIPLTIQVKLLRLLQENEIQRVGDTKPTRVDIRFLSATHRDLKADILAGRFREDLYYRLNLIEIHLPPLRERTDDISLLAHHFLRLCNQRFRKSIQHIAPETLFLLQSSPWPGNVRQLEHIIARAVILEESNTLLPHSLPADIKPLLPPTTPSPTDPFLSMTFQDAKQLTIERFEQAYLHHLLKHTDNNISHAARIANMDRANFRRLLKKYNLLSSSS